MVISCFLGTGTYLIIYTLESNAMKADEFRLSNYLGAFGITRQDTKSFCIKFSYTTQDEVCSPASLCGWAQVSDLWPSVSGRGPTASQGLRDG